jgi:hypothetical protein
MVARNVEISFECLPLRSVSRWDAPIDASPNFQAKCNRIQRAALKHGSFNTYFLHNATCVFHLTNNPNEGLLHFSFEGIITTDESDRRAVAADLQSVLKFESCDWLTEPVVRWFKDAMARAVMIDFDRYISTGDLGRTEERLALEHARFEASHGYVGMGL